MISIIFTVLLVISILGFLIGVFDARPVCLLAGTIFFSVSLAFCIVVPIKTVETATPYKSVIIWDSVIVKTSNGLEFRSDKYKDVENWNGKNPGYIIEKFSTFGLMASREFIVKQ